MKPIIYHEEESFIFETTGNEKYGQVNDFYVPKGTKIEKIYENYEDELYGEYTREVEFEVKNHVWKIVEGHGAGLETTTETLYTNKLGNFTEQELNFLNAYQQRFLYIKFDEKRFIVFDAQTNNYVFTPKLETFKDFKNELKKHFLID